MCHSYCKLHAYSARLESLTSVATLTSVSPFFVCLTPTRENNSACCISLCVCSNVYECMPLFKIEMNLNVHYWHKIYLHGEIDVSDHWSHTYTEKYRH